MSRFKDWVIEMQEDAEEMEYLEFLSKYGEVNADIWRDYHNPEYANHEPQWINHWSLLRGSMPKMDKPVGTLLTTLQNND